MQADLHLQHKIHGITAQGDLTSSKGTDHRQTEAAHATAGAT